MIKASHQHSLGGSEAVPERQARAESPEDLAFQAKTLADNLDRHQKLVIEGVQAMFSAGATRDVAAWQAGRKRAASGVAQIRDAVHVARDAEQHAPDTAVAARLSGAGELLADMERRLEGAPAAPEKLAASLSCADALLAALPPDERVTDAQQVYARAEAAVAGVFRGQMVFSDIAAFAELLAQQPDHEVARRFRRFGADRQHRLKAILSDSKVRARARVLEAARLQAAPLVAPPPGYSAPVTIDKPPEYDDTRATIDVNSAAPESGGPDVAAAHGAPDPSDAAARADGTAIDRPAEYQDSRATINVAAAHDQTVEPERSTGSPLAGHVPARNPQGAGSPAVEPGDPLQAADSVTAEPEIRALLALPIASDDIPQLRQRKTRLLALFGAIPSGEREVLRRRLADSRDDLGRAFHGELSAALRRDLMAALEGEAVPAPGLADSVEMGAFATTLAAGRFFAPPEELILDQAWQAARVVSVVTLPGWGPPADQPAPLVQWRLTDRMGEVVQTGGIPWQPAMPMAPPISVTIDQPGRWEVRIEVVDRGRVIAATMATLRARAAAEDGSDLPAVVPGGIADQMRATQSMGNGELTEQIGLVREQLGSYNLGAKEADKNAEFMRLRSALRELEFEASQRQVDGEPLSTGEPVEPLAQGELRAEQYAGPHQRALIQRRVDDLIATHGVEGGFARLKELEQELASDEASIHGGTYQVPQAIDWLREEFALRRGEAEGFVGAFDEHGRSVAYGLLVESEGRLRSEVERYGLKQEAAPNGSYGANGPKPGADVTALRDAVEHGRRIQAAHAKVIEVSKQRNDAEHAGALEEAHKEFEAEKLIAIAKHPMLRSFLEGDTDQARWAPTGVTPGLLTVGDYQPEHFGQFMGWEVNKKLEDNLATQERISAGTLSIFAVPKVVALTKQHMRTAPGTMLDGAINERVMNPPDANDWTSEMLAAISVALGLLLIVPTGGSSLAAGLAVAGEVTLLATDLYLLGKDFEQREIYQAATNTDMSVADSLLQEEPSAGPLIFRILGVLGPVAGVAGVAKSADDLAKAVARARDGIDAVRAVRNAAQAAGGELANPDVVAAIGNLRPIGRQAGMTDEEIDALIRTVGRNAVHGTLGAARASGGLDAAAEVTEALAPELARQLGVPRIVVTMDATRTVGVRPTLLRGRVVVEEVVVGRAATVADVLAHQVTVANLGRYDGIVGRVRQTWDEIAEAAGATPRANPHTPFTGAHEAFEEVRKYEDFIRARMHELAAALGRGGDDAAAAAARIEDEILLMEGELSHWRGALDEVRRTGDPGIARGVIEGKDIGRVNDEAIAAGYPPAPSDAYFYRRWPDGGGPEGQQFQLVRKSGVSADIPPMQPRKRGSGWELVENEGGRVPVSFSPSLTDEEVLAGMMEQSESLRAYENALYSKLQLSPGDVTFRMRAVVDRVRTPRAATAEQLAEGARRVVDEDNLRHALKQEFKQEFFAAAAKEPTPQAAMRKFRNDTAGLNPADSGNMMEEFLHQRDLGSVRHVEVDQAKLAGQDPAVSISQDRQIDRVRPDGTAVEVKSGAGELSGRELGQLEDYNTMAGRAVVDLGGQPTTVKGVMYEFTDPAGVRSNLDTIEDDMLARGMQVKVYNRSGETRTLADRGDLADLLDWLDR